jgi:phospholipid N-methyltransferase
MSIIKEFIKSPSTVGTIFPSSEHLAREMINGMDLHNAKTVLEIGPGSGAFTKHIAKQLSPSAKFIIVELNKQFHDNLKKKYPDLKIINDSAERLSSILEREAMGKADAVISSLPWAIFSEGLQRRIMDQIHLNLSIGGYFATYAYLHGTFLPGGVKIRKLIKDKFGNVKRSSTVWRNLPPAFVYKSRKM